jgi:hypothetical protein
MLVHAEKPASKPKRKRKASRLKAWKKLATDTPACIPSIEYRTWLEEGGATVKALRPLVEQATEKPLTGVTTACFKKLMGTSFLLDQKNVSQAMAGFCQQFAWHPDLIGAIQGTQGEFCALTAPVL